MADVTFESELPLPELEPRPKGEVEWRLVLAPTGTTHPRARHWHYWLQDDGTRWAAFARQHRTLLMRFPRIASFIAHDTSRLVTCHPAARVSPAALRVVVLNQVLPILLGQRRLVLHASAVADDEGALVFVGPRSRGKSTLAMSFAVDGYRLVSDDFVVIDEVERSPLAVPSGLDARLWPDSVEAVLPGTVRGWPVVGPGRSKRRIQPSSRAGVTPTRLPVPIRHIFLLDEPGPHLHLTAVAASEAVAELTRSSFLVGVEPMDRIHRAFQEAASIVAHVPVHRIVPTQAFEDLPAIKAAVRSRAAR